MRRDEIHLGDYLYDGIETVMVMAHDMDNDVLVEVVDSKYYHEDDCLGYHRRYYVPCMFIGRTIDSLWRHVGGYFR